MPGTAKPNKGTRRVMVGSVPLGGGAPVVVQSMLNAPAGDVAANLAQIEALAAAGCEVVRMAIPHKADLDAFEAVCAASPLPVVADIHFSADIAVEADCVCTDAGIEVCAGAPTALTLRLAGLTLDCMPCVYKL